MKVVPNPTPTPKAGEWFQARSGGFYLAKAIKRCAKDCGDRSCLRWCAKCDESGQSWYCIYGITASKV